MTVTVRNPGLKDQIDRWKNVSRLNSAALHEAARYATGASQRIFENRPDKRPPVPSRASRPSGNLQEAILWQVVGESVRFDVNRATLITALPKGGNYWMIQEVGTGQTAQMVEVQQDGELKTTAVSVSSQMGRRISPGLVFVTSAGVLPERPTRDYDQVGQLMPTSDAAVSLDSVGDVSLDGRSVGTGSPPPLLFHGGAQITREIQGKRYVGRAAILAAEQYRDQVVAMVRSAHGGKLTRGIPSE